MNGRCVCIVPFRDQSHVYGRRQGAKIVLDALRRSGFYIVLVEQDAESHAGNLYRDSHLLVPDDQPLFRRPFLLNLAWKLFPDETQMAVCEADVFVETHAWVRASAMLGQYDVVSPYRSYWMTVKSSAATFYDSDGHGELETLRRGARDHARGSPVALCGGAVMMTRRGWERAGGWDEGVCWLGADDIIQSHKVKTLDIPYALLDYTGYHLFHDRPREGRAGRLLHQKNARYCRSWTNMDRPQIEERVSARDYAVTPVSETLYRWLSQ